VETPLSNPDSRPSNTQFNVVLDTQTLDVLETVFFDILYSMIYTEQKTIFVCNLASAESSESPQLISFLYFIWHVFGALLVTPASPSLRTEPMQ